MTRLSPTDLADLRARNPIARIAEEFGAVLRPQRRGFIGSCPLCGSSKPRAATRFEITGDRWVCAACQQGGDVIKLVRLATGGAFRDAVERLGGTRVLSDGERAGIDREIAAREAKREAESARYRDKELATIKTIWRTAAVGDRVDVTRYLTARGLIVPDPLFARAVAGMSYFHGEFVPVDEPYGRAFPRCVHTGPAMLAAMQDNDGAFCGLHITWLDAATRGKALIHDPDTGEVLPAKKMRGSTKAAHINLAKCAQPARLFLGEGIETVLSVRTALLRTGQLLDTDAFWAAGSLGALAGPARETIAHPTLKTLAGRAQRVPGDGPDCGKPAIAIPASVRELVLLGDGDSDPFTTRLALARATARHQREGLAIRSVFADAGADFNDMLQGEAA